MRCDALFVVGLLAVKYLNRRIVIGLLLPVVIVCGSFQFFLNSAVQSKHYALLPANRTLLVAFTDKMSLDDRCTALGNWLHQSLPDYYTNSMTTGIERAYQHFRHEPFCGRF